MAGGQTLSLCTGVGALDQAVAQVTGIVPTLHAEADPWAARVLAARVPEATNLGDITKIDWDGLATSARRVIAGWPCQGISNSGLRLGLDDPRSGLWRNVAAAIRAIRPEEVFLENVAALKTRGLPTVAGNLNELGYDLYWTITRASAIGAAHPRARFIGYAVPGAGVTVEVPAPADPFPPVRMLPTPKASDGEHGGPNQRDGADNFYLPGVAVRLDEDWRSEELGVDYGPAVRRWEDVLGRPAPSPTSPDARGNLRVNPAAVEWLMGYPDAWVTGLDGIPRAQQIKLAGNGVVPHQGVAAFQLLRRTPAPLQLFSV